MVSVMSVMSSVSVMPIASPSAIYELNIGIGIGSGNGCLYGHGSCARFIRVGRSGPRRQAGRG
jgi:hypothetical protein